MNSQNICGIRRLLLAMLIALPLCVSAGERIEIGTKKSKFAPPQDSRLSRELSKHWGTKLDGDPGNELTVAPRYNNVEVWDPKKEKMRKLKETEEKNWMLMDPGTLRDKEEEKLGGVEEDPDSYFKEDKTKDWLFTGIGKDANSKEESPGTHGTQRTPGNKANAPKPPPNSQEDDEFIKSIRATLSSSSAKTEPQVGSHTSRELDFRTLFEPASSKDRGMAKADSDFSENFFRDGGLGLLPKDKQAMREEYRSFLNGPSKVADPLGINVEPKGLSSSPLLSKPGELGGLENLGARGINDAPFRQDWNVGRVSGFGTLPSPALTPPVREEGLQPRYEGGKARGLNSLGGH